MTDFPTQPPEGPPPAEVAEPAPATKTRPPWLIPVAVLVVLVAVGGFFVTRGGSSGASSAVSACTKQVRSELKAPATAAFDADAKPETKKTADGDWAIAGRVDSQNGFGAQIRTRYICLVGPTSGVAALEGDSADLAYATLFLGVTTTLGPGECTPGPTGHLECVN